MSEVSKFIPMEEYDEGVKNGVEASGMETSGSNVTGNSAFKVCATNSNLPAKQSTFWAKLKSALTKEIKVELTPAQQKIEDEINEFLHQEITWQSFKNFLFQEVTIGKKQ